MSQQGMAILLSIAFALILIIGFFIGFWRGWKRSLLNFGCSVIGMSISFFVTKPICDAILGIKVSSGGSSVTLNQYFINLLREADDVALLMDSNPNVSKVVAGLPSAIASTLVFLVVSCLIALVIYCIYKIFCIMVKYRPAEKKYRWAGAGIGLVKTFVLTIIAFMPFASLLSTMDTVTTRENYVVGTSVEQTGNKYGYVGEYVPSEAIEVIKGANDSILCKICNVGGMADNMFDYFGSVNVDGEDLKIREEVVNYYQVLDFKYELEHSSSLKFSNVNYDRLEKAIDKILNSTLYKKVVATTLSDIIVNYENYSFVSGLKAEYGDILDQIGSKLKTLDENNGNVDEYFSNDIKSAFQIFKILGENGVIDDIQSISDKQIKNILNVLTSDENKPSFNLSVEKLFEINMVKDSVSQILKKYSGDLVAGLDSVGVDTTDWEDENWKQTADSLTNLADDFSKLDQLVDFNEVLTDATILLDKDSDYNIPLVLSTLGKLIDDARGINLLTTAEGKSIFDKLLIENNISLPAYDEIIKDANGNVVEISSYTKLFEFLSNPLVRLKKSGMYEIITSESSSKVKDIASIISLEGNENLLKEIILPLNEVEPTKTLIMDNMTSSLGGSFIDLSGLNTYDEWNKDLGYLSSLLILLNNTKMSDSESISYLDKILDNKINEMFDDVSQAQIDGIVKPILYAKATTSLKQDLIDNIYKGINDITGKTGSVIVSSITFEEGASEDQTEEVCIIMKSLTALKGESGNIKDMNENNVKALLKTLQANAYRTSKNTALKEEGAFSGAYKSVVDKLKSEFVSEYGDIFLTKVEEKLGEGYLSEENYGNIDFDQLFDTIDEIKSELSA